MLIKLNEVKLCVGNSFIYRLRCWLSGLVRFSMDKETIKTFIELLPAIATIIAVVVSYYIFFRSVRANSKPVLIFTSRGKGTRWKLQNYGNGPAINILVAESETFTHWNEAVNCYPLAINQSVELIWVKRAEILAATYSNIYGEQFTSICQYNQTKVKKGNKFPKWESNKYEWTQRELAKKRKYLREEDLEGHCNLYLDKMRYEPYARLGYIFDQKEQKELKEHFSQQNWYKPKTSNKQEIEAHLTEKEKCNSDFIKIYQYIRRVEGKQRLEKAKKR